MSAVYPLQSSFTNGEISPLLASRVDIDLWRTSLAYCRNFQILSHGGIRRRSGTRFVAEVRSSSAIARLFPFRFSEAQSYVLCLNNGYIRFVAQRGVVGSPYEVAHPWSSSDIARLSYTQFNDVAYFAHKSYAPRKLARAGDTSWSISAETFEDGPYLELNETATTMKLGGTNTLGSSTVSSGSPSGNDEISASGVCDAYTIKAPATPQNDRAPVEWTFEGYDGAGWVVLDTRSESGWGGGETRFFSFENQTSFTKYRIAWSAVNGADKTDFTIRINVTGATMTPVTMTASSVTGINGGSGFQTTDVGRMFRLRGADGKWRWGYITARTSTTIVSVRIYGYPMGTTGPFMAWHLGAWSASSGYPAAVALYNERLAFARSNAQPANVWASKQGDFTDFGVSDPLVDTDGLSIQLLSSNMNEILWLADDVDLVTGSAGQIRSIGPSDITQAFSATNITQKKGPTSGASYLQPLSVGGVTLYVADGGAKIRELVLGDQNRYVAPELTVLAEHMFKSGIVDWAFAEKPDPTIYAVTGDGLVVAITYDREQKVLGFARHDFGGIVENVAVIPSVNAGVDDVYFVIRRTINGSTKRYIEVLEQPFDGDTMDIKDACFVDSALTYSGTPISTVTGLGHLEGRTVQAFADGQYVGTFTVSSGSITLPGSFAKITVGLQYVSRAQTLPVAGPGQDGYLFGRRKSVTAAFIDVLHSGSLRAGAAGDDNWAPALPEHLLPEGGGMFTAPTALRTGFVRCDFDSSWTVGQGKITIRTGDPLPLLIRAIVLQTETEP